MPLTVCEELIPAAWPRATKGTVWFLQPRLQVRNARPFRHEPASGGTTPFELLQAACENERRRPAEDGPVFFLLPEFALGPDECDRLRDLAAASPERFIFIAGAGQLRCDEALRIEDRPDLWGQHAPGALANCAVIAFGRNNRLYLQPKIVPSGPERDHHWAGKAVRYFLGNHLSFAVLICSELYAQAEAQTTVRQLLEKLEDNSRKLRLLVWIQHNPKPRSAAFSQSIQQLSNLSPKTTVFLACSRADPPGRVDNFAVSGALVPHDSLPSRFCDLDRRFHYVEPVPDARHARVVFLRYDADAYRVRTLLGDQLNVDSGVAKSGLMEEATPYVASGTTLNVSDDQAHLRDLSLSALKAACQLDAALAGFAAEVRDELVRAETPGFLRVLDLSTLVAQKPEGHARGFAGHEPGFLCRCWRHRVCLDNLAADTDGPLTGVIWALAVLRDEGVPYTLVHDPSLDITCRAQIGTQSIPLRLLDSGHTTLEGIRERMAVSDSLGEAPVLILLGSALVPARPAVGSINAAHADPIGTLRAARCRSPLPSAVSRAEFGQAHLSRRVGERVLEAVRQTERGA